MSICHLSNKSNSIVNKPKYFEIRPNVNEYYQISEELK
jgi:hypothetical protein